jgi:acetylornithine deacetylase/succinyl-diaminopimelate desuccinylase-like protein
VSTSKAVPPAVVDARHPGVNAARRAARASFGRDPVLVRSGGTIPVVGILRRAVGIDSVLLGFSLPDDGMHGPNERLHLPTFEQGVATCIRLLGELAVERRRSRTLVA